MIFYFENCMVIYVLALSSKNVIYYVICKCLVTFYHIGLCTYKLKWENLNEWKKHVHVRRVCFIMLVSLSRLTLEYTAKP